MNNRELSVLHCDNSFLVSNTRFVFNINNWLHPYTNSSTIFHAHVHKYTHAHGRGHTHIHTCMHPQKHPTNTHYEAKFWHNLYTCKRLKVKSYRKRQYSCYEYVGCYINTRHVINLLRINQIFVISYRNLN